MVSFLFLQIRQIRTFPELMRDIRPYGATRNRLQVHSSMRSCSHQYALPPRSPRRALGYQKARMFLQKVGDVAGCVLTLSELDL